MMIADFLRRLLRPIPMPEPALPGDRTALLPAEDTEEADEADDVGGVLGAALFISYRDSKGATSERRITLRSIRESSEGRYLLNAYCFERRAPRVFRADRILETVDLATGEVILDEQALLARLGVIADDTVSGTRASTAMALESCKHALSVLVYFARCDGEFHPNEEDVVVNYIVKQCFNLDLDDEYLTTRIRGLYPDTDTFFDSLDYLEANEPQTLSELGRYVAQLVQADGRVVAAELNFLAELEAYIS